MDAQGVSGVTAQPHRGARLAGGGLPPVVLDQDAAVQQRAGDPGDRLLGEAGAVRDLAAGDGPGQPHRLDDHTLVERAEVDLVRAAPGLPALLATDPAGAGEVGGDGFPEPAHGLPLAGDAGPVRVVREGGDQVEVDAVRGLRVPGAVQADHGPQEGAPGGAHRKGVVDHPAPSTPLGRRPALPGVPQGDGVRRRARVAAPGLGQVPGQPVLATPLPRRRGRRDVQRGLHRRVDGGDDIGTGRGARRGAVVALGGGRAGADEQQRPVGVQIQAEHPHLGLRERRTGGHGGDGGVAGRDPPSPADRGDGRVAVAEFAGDRAGGAAAVGCQDRTGDDLGLVDDAGPPGPWAFPQARHAGGVEALPPVAHRLPGDLEPPGDLGVAQPLGGEQDDGGADGARTALRHPVLQQPAVLLGQSRGVPVRRVHDAPRASRRVRIWNGRKVRANTPCAHVSSAVGFSNRSVTWTRPTANPAARVVRARPPRDS